MERKQSWLAGLTFALLATVACSLCHASQGSEDGRVPIGTTKVPVSKIRADLIQQLTLAQQAEEATQDSSSDTQLVQAEDADQGVNENLNVAANEGEESESPLLVVDSEGHLAPPSACSDCAVKKASYIILETEPIDYHHVSIFAYTSNSCILESEDGALWRVTSNTAPLSYWYQGHDILIYPSPWWCSSPFELYNRQTKTSVYANLDMGPFYNDARWIVDLSWATGEVWLSDGSYWIVSNLSRFLEWSYNHTVLIGTNNEWITDYPNLLINVNLYDPHYPKYSYVKAVCISGPLLY